MRRILHLVLSGTGVATALALAACSKPLPEPTSRGAQLYTQHCSGSGCHSPIPPDRDVAGYWDMQFTRMLDLMRREGRSLPTAAEQREILNYLHRNAYDPGG